MHTEFVMHYFWNDIQQSAELLLGGEAPANAGFVGVTKGEKVQTELQAIPHEVRWYIAKFRKPIRNSE